MQQCPKSLSATTFCALLVEQALDSGSRLPAYRVGAGHQNGVSHTLPLQFPPALEVTNSEAPTEAVEAVPKKNKTTRVVPQSLSHLDDLIQEFWRAKKGSKSETAWTLLMTELGKIADAYGVDRVDEQLRLAINGKWQGITLRNLESFEKGRPTAKTATDWDAIEASLPKTPW